MRKVLIAEDDKMTRIILRQQLKKWGYDILEAENGEDAYKLLSGQDSPSIAILDWMMPIMNGIETCRKLKEDSNNTVYIIILTSKDSNEDIVEALESGADDFMSKPVNSAVLHSRLNVAKRTMQYRERLTEYANSMENLAKQRAEQLVHADRLVTIGTMASSIVHEINNPLSVISSTNQIFAQYWGKLEPLVQSAVMQESAGKEFFNYMLEEYPLMIESLKNNVGRINKIISNLKRFYRKDAVEELTEYSLNEAIKNSLDITQAKLKNIVNVKLELTKDPLLVKGIAHQIDQVIVNIIVNATEAIYAKTGGKFMGNILIASKREGHEAIITLENDGGHIPQELLEKIWNSFYTTKEEGTGLGLSISLDIIKAHGGKMSAENLTDGKSIRFTLTLPLFNNKM